MAWFRIFFGRKSAAAGGQPIERSVRDGIYFLDPTTRDEQHQLTDGLLANDWRTSDAARLVSIALMFGDQQWTERSPQFMDNLLLGTSRASGLDIARLSTLYLNDASALERFLLHVEGLLLGSSGVASTLGAGAEYAAGGSDGIFFGDINILQQNLDRVFLDQVLLGESRLFDLLLVRLVGLLLGSSGTTSLLGAGAEYTAGGSDGLFLSDARFSDLLLVRLVGLLLGSSGVGQYIPAGQTLYDVAPPGDGLLLGDVRLSDIALRDMAYMLLDDIGMTGAERLREAIDKVLLSDYPTARDRDISAADQLAFDERIIQMRELLWNEGMYLDDAAERAVLAAVLAYLVYARLRVVDFMHIQSGAVDLLGRTIGVTKWRLH